MLTNALAFYIHAPMQAWGASSKFQRRDTEAHPTKSAVLGLVAAAMGIDKNQLDEPARIEELSDLGFSTARLVSSENNEIRRLNDYHTVGGGYDTKTQKLFITRKASGGTSTTILTHRAYLTDARFVVVLEGSCTLLEKIRDALNNPVWGVWFGRKACLPSAPLIPVIAASKQEAVDALCARVPLEGLELHDTEYREESGDGCWYLSDQPVSFGRREYKQRPVSRVQEK